MSIVNINYKKLKAITQKVKEIPLAVGTCLTKKSGLFAGGDPMVI